MTISEQILHPSGTDETPAPIAPVAEPPAPIPVAVEPAPVVAEAITVPPAEVVEPPSDTEPEEQGGVTCVLWSAWNWTACAARVLNGVRTLLFFGITGILAIGAKLGDVDIAGTISYLVGEKVSSSDIIAFMSISGIVLRFLTTTQVFARWRKAAQGDKIPEASAAVDEPEDTQ